MTSIYQTLEDRWNYEEVINNGPYYCSLYDEKGSLKKGIKVPWLGEGYYFWDTREEDAKWWGECTYSSKGKRYIVCKTTYDQQSDLLFDTLADLSKMDDLVRCAELIKEKWKINKVSFPFILSYLKETGNFNYKAIRVWPDPNNKISKDCINIFFPGEKTILSRIDKVQICFFDRTLLDKTFKIVYPNILEENFTI